MSGPESCACCHDLAPPGDANTSRSLCDVENSAAKGCESCSLIRQAVHDCVPEALVSQNVENHVEVVIRQAILRHFVELVVKWDNDKAIILDLFVEAGKLQIKATRINPLSRNLQIQI